MFTVMNVSMVIMIFTKSFTYKVILFTNTHDIYGYFDFYKEFHIYVRLYILQRVSHMRFIVFYDYAYHAIFLAIKKSFFLLTKFTTCTFLVTWVTGIQKYGYMYIGLFLTMVKPLLKLGIHLPVLDI